MVPRCAKRARDPAAPRVLRALLLLSEGVDAALKIGQRRGAPPLTMLVGSVVLRLAGRLLSVFRRDAYIIFCHTARPERGTGSCPLCV